MTIVCQSSPTQKTSIPLRHRVWISPLTLSSLSYLLSRLHRKYPLTHLHLTRRLLQALQPTIQSPTKTLDVALSASIGSQFSIFQPGASQSENTQELPPFSSFRSDVRPLLSKPNQLKLQLDHSALGRQHHREYYTNHARRTKQHRFNQHIQYCLQPEFCSWEIIFLENKHQEYTIQSRSLLSQRLVVPPQAITELPRRCRLTLLHQLSSLIIHLPLNHLFRCATLLQLVSLWLN